MPTLNWLGKNQVVNHHLHVPFHFLDKKYSVGNSENKIIHGDNLLALKSLLPRYENKIKCIYIDPPYNTGNENWIYNDNVSDPRLQKWLGQVVGKEGEDLTRHDKWLCMMYPRLRLLQKLLRDDGAIFISIDDNEVFYLKCICDEIFGASNFVGEIAVVNNLKGRNDRKNIATCHEHLLIYGKPNFEAKGMPLTEEQRKQFDKVDENGRNYQLRDLRKRGRPDRREDRPNMYFPIYYNEITKECSLEFHENWIEIFPKRGDDSDGRWRWGKDKVQANLSILEPKFSKIAKRWGIESRIYLDDLNSDDEEITERLSKSKSFWTGGELSTDVGRRQVKEIFGADCFDYPKPIDFIIKILHMATDKNSIVLDSFAGSGTTAHAVINLNKQDGGSRRFILIELNDYAENITAERVRRIGGEFTFYELGERLFDENEFINAAVPFEKICEYIYYSETFKNYVPTAEKNLLGVDNYTAYYYFNDALSWTTLAQIKTRARNYVIYAENCYLSEDELNSQKITFKQIPFDIMKY